MSKISNPWPSNWTKPKPMQEQSQMGINYHEMELLLWHCKDETPAKWVIYPCSITGEPLEALHKKGHEAKVVVGYFFKIQIHINNRSHIKMNKRETIKSIRALYQRKVFDILKWSLSQLTVITEESIGEQDQEYKNKVWRKGIPQSSFYQFPRV